MTSTEACEASSNYYSVPVPEDVLATRSFDHTILETTDECPDAAYGFVVVKISTEDRRAPDTDTTGRNTAETQTPTAEPHRDPQCLSYGRWSGSSSTDKQPPAGPKRGSAATFERVCLQTYPPRAS